MVEVVKPADSRDLKEIISDALHAQKSLEISGTGSKKYTWPPDEGEPESLTCGFKWNNSV